MASSAEGLYMEPFPTETRTGPAVKPPVDQSIKWGYAVAANGSAVVQNDEEPPYLLGTLREW